MIEEGHRLVSKCGRRTMIRQYHPSWRAALVLALGGTIALAAIVAVSSLWHNLRRGETACRLKHIEVALAVYHQEHGSFPPQYLVDEQGKPVHSWRVLLLPYLGYEELYRRYRFDEPWNGPHNRLLATEMPQEYRSPFQESTSTITQYVGIAGKNTPWQGAKPLGIKDMERDDSNPTIWFVEAANSDITWMEPRDIPLKQALAGIAIVGRSGIKSNYVDGLPAEMTTYGSEWVPADMPLDAWRAMLTIGHKD